MREEKWVETEAYAYWLSSVAGLGNKTRTEIAEFAGSPREVFYMPEKELRKLTGNKKAELIIKGKEKGDIMAQYRSFAHGEIQYFSRFHPNYPDRLSRIADAPFGIYVWGHLPNPDKKAVAVIGARQCSQYGRHMAKQCTTELAEAGIEVVSGMARGIDGISQAAAIEAGGNTYAVLGCGVEVCYPEENRNIYEKVKYAGGILSEFSPNTQPKAPLFPLRNRIISGLSDAVLIIEAREKSGTLITADMALEQGREVYAVPGRITDNLSEGCNQLIKQGAGVFTSVKEMLEELGWNWHKEKGNVRETADSGEDSKGSALEQRIWKALDFYPKSAENIGKEAEADYRMTVCLLMRLCLEGKARQVSAGCFVRNE